MTILVIGGGKMGMSHLALISRYLGKPEVALCDTSRVTRAVFRLLGYRTFGSPEAALRRLGRVDGVLIATPTASHAGLAQWAITRKIPVFVEKPLTLDAAQSRDLAALAAAAQVPNQMGFVLRHVASFRWLREVIGRGQLGDVQGYVATMRGNVITRPLDRGDWRGDVRRGGGCLNEYGPHLIDLCRFVFGPVAQVTAAEHGRTFSTRADDRFLVRWRHGSGVEGRIEADWCDPAMRKSVTEFRVTCAHARLRVDNSAVEIDWAPDAPVPAEVRAAIAVPPNPPNVGFYLRGEEFSVEIEDFLTTCLGRDLRADPAFRSAPAPGLDDGCAVDELIGTIAVMAGLA